jgi:hypothetical protein
MNDHLPFSAAFQAGFAGQFDTATMQRGRAYAAEGRARVRHIERGPGEIHVEAEVQGTRKQPYEVDLWLEVDPAGAIVDVDNICMCPMQENCKHVVAVMLSLGPMAGVGGIAGPQDAERQAEDSPEPSQATLDWLNSLDEPMPPASPSRNPQARVVYLLRTGSPPTLVLGRSRRLKNGGYGKAVAYRPQPYDLAAERSHRDFILDDDIAPLRLFLALQAGVSTTRPWIWAARRAPCCCAWRCAPAGCISTVR